MGKPTVDYSLYLVTDSTPAILGDRDICEVVRAACKGGVTIVQYRDKKSDTGVLIETASKLHAITKEYNVPLLINDRVDVALAVGCEGVHIGQDDISESCLQSAMGCEFSDTKAHRLFRGKETARPGRHRRRHCQHVGRGSEGL